MTPKEKSDELIEKYRLRQSDDSISEEAIIFQSKQCVMLTIEEILKVTNNHNCDYYYGASKFWELVKEETGK